MFSITQRAVFVMVTLFLISSIISLVSVAHAQDAATKVSPHTLATINIQNVAHTQQGNAFTISFDIVNREGVQPGVKYGIALRQKGSDGEVLFDERAESEVLTLGPMETLTRQVTYAAPATLRGTYALYLIARNTDGFTLGSSKVADVILERTASGAYIDLSTCYLTHASGTEKYAPREGVVVSEVDTLVSHCVVENTGTETLDIFPRTETYRRSVFGETMPLSPLHDVKPLTLAPGERREVHTTLPLALDPQTYITKLAYGYVSNAVWYAYVVRGGSAAIQNIRFDKDAYKAGDTARVSFNWSGSSELESPQALISFATKTGDACAESFAYPLTGSAYHEIMVPITTDCPEPDVAVLLSDDAKGMLGTYAYDVDETPVVSQDVVAEAPSTAWSSLMGMRVLLGIAAFVFMVLVIIFMRRKKEPETPMIPPVPMAFILGIMSIASLMPSHAEASTLYVASPTRYVSFTISLDQAQYDPNEWITITGEAQLENQEDCGDLGQPPGCNDDRSVSLSVGGQEIFTGNLGPFSTISGTAQVRASTIAGMHQLAITARNQMQVETSSESYQVVAAQQSCAGTIASGARAGDSSDSVAQNAGSSWHYVAQNTAERCEFVCMEGQVWNGSSACVPESSSGGGGTPSITAVPCVIPLGGSTCSIPGAQGVGITVTGAPNGALFVRDANVANSAPRLFSGTNPPISADWVRPHIIFELYSGSTQQNGTIVPVGNPLGSVTNVAVCAQGSVWSPENVRCVAAPPTQGGQFIGVCRQQSPVPDSDPQGDPGCPAIAMGGAPGVEFGWNYAANYVTASILHGRTLSVEVSGLQPGAKMCKVFMVHPDSWQVPSPMAYAHQFCTYESNYSNISVSNGRAQIDIPNVDPDYKSGAQYLLFFKNPGATSAVKMSGSVTSHGTGGGQGGTTTHYCSTLGPDIGLYLGQSYTINNIGTPVPIIFNYGSQLAGAQWTVSAVEYNAMPGDSLTFSRTTGTFTADGSTVNPNNQLSMTVLGTPRTVGVKVEARTSAQVCGSTLFSAFGTVNLHYAGVGQAHPCSGTVPPNASPWSGGEGTTNAPNTPWRFSPYDNLGIRCEFKCSTGYMWDAAQNSCVLNAGGTGGPDAWKWKISPIPRPEFGLPPPACTANMSAIRDGDSCTVAQSGTCDANGNRYTCRDITTEYPYFLIGRVVDMNGQPVSGLNIAAGFTGPAPHHDYRVYTTTGTDGRYRLRIEGGALHGYIRVPRGLPFDLTEPTPGYVYWNGGQIRQDQITIQNGEKLVPVLDMVVRAVQTQAAANGSSVITANAPDLLSTNLYTPRTGVKGTSLTISANVLNQTTTATPAGFQDRFSYRWGTTNAWQDFTPLEKSALGTGESATDQISFSPPAAGELWIKHCVNTGTVFPEYNADNNCSEGTTPIIVADPASGLRWRQIEELVEGYSGSLPALCIDAPVVGVACSASAAVPSPCYAGDYIYRCE
jgi:hypothetical protein